MKTSDFITFPISPLLQETILSTGRVREDGTIDVSVEQY